MKNHNQLGIASVALVLILATLTLLVSTESNPTFYFQLSFLPAALLSFASSWSIFSNLSHRPMARILGSILLSLPLFVVILLTLAFISWDKLVI